MTSSARPSFLNPTDTFVRRHIGPDDSDVKAMLQTVGLSSLDELVAQTVPADIRLNRPLAPMTANEPRGESEMLAEFRASCKKNEVLRSFIGMGYSGTIVPPVIQRNILENPGWYTQYTPYQAEIAQGRLEALLNFQTLISDLTGLPMAGASLLDEATAAAEAVNMCYEIGRGKRHTFFVSDRCHPQVVAVVQTRAEALGIKIAVGAMESFDFASGDVFGALLPYPTTDGQVLDLEPLVAKIHDAGALAVVDADLLALTLLRAPGDFGADIAIGSAQRFGVPFGFGGPHAAYLSTKSEYKREMPGRLIGVSKDAQGNRALRMALQTREQHIRREKATSNICTAQVLLAVMAGMYGVYHGPRGLEAIARRVHGMTKTLAKGLEQSGFALVHANVFDTLAVDVEDSAAVIARARALGVNLRALSAKRVGIALDETTEARDLTAILEAFGGARGRELSIEKLAAQANVAVAPALARKTAYLTHPVFNTHHSEHEMLRYMRALEAKDL
ncbi:MAG TPA: glycine dehydrogenase (aminomethyl-transferring), partial [Planctomycetota bacterium]|nr:glycine dehydrogenase (aminomethyl-transferring) [Planctomycetota bacterium]